MPTNPLIALVHDDDAILELLERLLIEEGYRTHTSGTGPWGWQTVLDAKPDLVVLDLALGNSGPGWSILELLRLEPATTRIPVVLCCADRDFLDKKRTLLEARCC